MSINLNTNTSGSSGIGGSANDLLAQAAASGDLTSQILEDYEQEVESEIANQVANNGQTPSNDNSGSSSSNPVSNSPTDPSTSLPGPMSMITTTQLGG